MPVKGVRKHTAAAMVASAFTAPHVTEFLTLDMTPTMELRARVQAMPEFAGVKVSPLLFVAKALLLAVSRNPQINSSWDEQAQEIVVKDYVNLGIAAATPRGLLVPNVKDADQLSLVELARALQSLAETAREGRTSPGRHDRRHDHDHQRRDVRRRQRHPDPQPGRGGDPVLRRRPPDAVGRRRRDRRALR